MDILDVFTNSKASLPKELVDEAEHSRRKAGLLRAAASEILRLRNEVADLLAEKWRAEKPYTGETPKPRGRNNTMRTPEAEYDTTLNLNTGNQEAASEAFFEIIQEIRRLAAKDDETPGRLSGREILGVALENFGDAADVIGDAARDEVANGTDAFNIVTTVVRQLDPFTPSD